ncbi:aspartyl protease family protein [Robiginitalea sp. SC105]|uniref:aspartyl protease family protein n=1 Tax=Robiginitalea sp. SC105 TaxID=2762332 RepID=UPI00163B503D|nr:aspartyl protease family protein [Robiginitalea sp. SC105]MBC2839081.1 aspartyl protease family protein [Robiginitalea sp. SC105]
MNGIHFLKTVFLLLLLLICPRGEAQHYQLLDGAEKSPKIRFELVNNLMIIPVEVNGTPLRFILDTGVSKPILFNLSDTDSVELRNVAKIQIQGLGTGDPIDALSSAGNIFKVRGMVNPGQLVYVVLDRDMNFSPSLGVTIHGIIGYDLFRDHVVEINYGRRYLRFHNPATYRQRKRSREVTIPITVDRNKAYVEGGVTLEGGEELAVKLLMDTGSSDALWLFRDEQEGLQIPEKNYEDYLGKGLSGTIYGKRTKVKQIRIGDFVLRDAKAAFPYLESFKALPNLGDRDGSVGGELLKRFNMVINYPSGELTLRTNNLFGEPFHFNLAGIELEHAGMRYIAERITDTRGVVQRDEEDTFGTVQILTAQRTRLSLVPEIIVSAIRAGSPAEEVGLQEGDVILAVNGKSVHRYKLQEVMKMINDKKGKRIRLLIERYNKDLLFSFVLRELFE